MTLEMKNLGDVAIGVYIPFCKNNIIFVGEGSGTNTKLITYTFNGSSFSKKDEVLTGTDINDIFADDTYVYIALSGVGYEDDRGLKVYSYDVNGTLTYKAHTEEGIRVYSVFKNSSTLYYIASGGALKAVDFDSSFNFTTIATATCSNLGKMRGKDDSVFITGGSGVDVFTLSGSQLTGGIQASSSPTNDLNIVNNTLYTATKSSSIQVFNIDGSTINLTHEHSIDFDTTSAWFDGTYIYVGTSLYQAETNNVNYVLDTSYAEVATFDGSTSRITGDGTYIYSCSYINNRRALTAWQVSEVEDVTDTVSETPSGTTSTSPTSPTYSPVPTVPYVVTTTTTTAPTTTTTTTTLAAIPSVRVSELKSVNTKVVTPSIENLGTDSSDSKGTLETINSMALSFGPLAPGETSPTSIIYLQVPQALAVNNIRLALIDSGGLTFGNTTFGVEIQPFIDYNIVPSEEFSGVNETKDVNSPYNVSISSRDLQNSNYVYLNVSIPTGQLFGTGTIRYKWFFDYT